MIVVALFVYAAALFLNMPGAVIARKLNLPGLELVGVQGSLYQGQVTHLVWHGQSLGRLRWQLKPWSLLGLTIKEQITLDGPLSGTFNVFQSPLSKGVENLHLSFSAQALNRAVSLPFQTQGTFQVKLNKLALSNHRCQSASGQVDWKKPQLSTLFGKLSLSPVSVQISCSRGQYVAKVNHQGQMLVLQGSAQFSDLRWQVDLKARPSAHFPKRLRALLEPHGAPSADGFYSFKSQGVF